MIRRSAECPFADPRPSPNALTQLTPFDAAFAMPILHAEAETGAAKASPATCPRVERRAA